MEINPPAIAVTLTGVAMLCALVLYVMRSEIRGVSNPEPQPRGGDEGWGDLHTKLDTVIEDLHYLRRRIDNHIDNHEKWK